MNRSYYANKVSHFLADDENSILGELTRNHEFALEDLQKNAWLGQIQILRRELVSFENDYLLFEFSIPRMGKRVDAILIHDEIIFVIEFKVGNQRYSSHAIDQVIDYSIDLKNFHEGSHHRILVPVLVATKASPIENHHSIDPDRVMAPILTNANNLADNINKAIAWNLKENGKSEYYYNPIDWLNSRYMPTPTIIEAAQAMYRGHDVSEISRSDASAINLSITTGEISKIVNYSKSNSRKSICFVTGVPGSGKTLAGLNIANEWHKFDESEHSVFLSGNGPLVKVLQEALARDESKKSKNITKQDSLTKTKAFIQNIHHFRDEAILNNEPPIEKVVIFDEAQRAWDKTQTSNFMLRRKGVVNFDQSEPEFLIGVMDRHQDWATIICLVGGGQEINKGEAGLVEWLSAIHEKYPLWDVYVSQELSDTEYLRGHELEQFIIKDRLNIRNNLHLAVSIRSYRSEKVSEFVKALLDCDQSKASTLIRLIEQSYPIALTRNLSVAKRWLIDHARGSERFGVIASSGGIRLRPFGINVKAEIDERHWFLNDKNDIRSCYFLEEVATEFHIQGLELDWTCVAWDADLRFDEACWQYKDFRGTKWQNVNNERRRLYLKNAYRVLLTRARQGMILFIPEGNEEDYTRLCEFYDSTFDYLCNIGLQQI